MPDELYEMLTVVASFFRMGTNFLRLIHATPTFFKKFSLPASFGLPPVDEEVTSLNAEVMDYFTMNYKGFIAAGSDEAWSTDSDNGSTADREAQLQEDIGDLTGFRDRRRRVFLYKKSWREFLDCFPCKFWSPNAAIKPHSNDFMMPDDMLKYVVRCFCHIVLRSLPGKPVKAKWTKFWGAVAWQMLSNGVFSFLTRV